MSIHMRTHTHANTCMPKNLHTKNEQRAQEKCWMQRSRRKTENRPKSLRKHQRTRWWEYVIRANSTHACTILLAFCFVYMFISNSTKNLCHPGWNCLLTLSRCWPSKHIQYTCMCAFVECIYVHVNMWTQFDVHAYMSTDLKAVIIALLQFQSQKNHPR